MLTKPYFAALGATIAMLAVVAPAPRVDAAAIPACTATSGVSVIVDFTHFGGNIERSCAPGQPSTALAALQASGFGTAGTANYGDAFLCRINDLPPPKSEACTVTPPASASWSFYFARPADSDWVYSTAGVSSYRPHSGTIIAFAFGNHAKPRIPPSAVILTGSTTTTTSRPSVPPPTVAPTTPPASTQVTAPLTSTATTTTSATSPTTSGRTTTTVARAVSTSSGVATSTSAPLIVVRQAAGPTSHDSSGSPLPALLTVALVAILGGAAAVTIRARRRRAA